MAIQQLSNGSPVVPVGTTDPSPRVAPHGDLSTHPHAQVAALFRALSEPTRLAIVHCLAEGPARVADLTGRLGLAQSTVSAHVAILREVGLVVARPAGRSTWYSLHGPGLDDLLHAAERFVEGSEP